MANHQSPMDFDALAGAMSALGYPLRLELLHRLRLPQAMRDITVAPQRSTGKVAARQTVEAHLRKLMAAGMVRSETRKQGGRDVQVFGTDPQQLWGFTEQVRRLSSLHAGQGMSADATQVDGAAAPPPRRPDGPHLVLVHGLPEGHTVPLRGAEATIGRSKDATVSLHYDGFASDAHARITRKRRRFFLEDLGSRNGTTLNWRRAADGEPVELQAGDIIGVGHSLLCFRS